MGALVAVRSQVDGENETGETLLTPDTRRKLPLRGVVRVSGVPGLQRAEVHVGDDTPDVPFILGPTVAAGKPRDVFTRVPVVESGRPGRPKISVVT